MIPTEIENQLKRLEENVKRLKRIDPYLKMFEPKITGYYVVTGNLELVWVSFRPARSRR